MTDRTTAKKPVGGTTAEALARLRALDQDRHAEIEGYKPIAWLAHQVNKLRTQQKISQTSLASALSTTQPTISRLESGEVDPSFSRACEVLSALGYRLVPVPITEEPVIVGTLSELQASIHETIEGILPELERKAMSDALVRIADTGLMGDVAPMTVDVVAPTPKALTSA